MDNKLLEENKTIDINYIVEKINYIIDKNFEVLDLSDDIEKWNTIPKLLLLENKEQKKLIEFAVYVDSLLIDVSSKAKYIITLSCMMDYMPFKIEKFDEANLLLLVDYYQKKGIQDMKNTFGLVSNQALLSAIRRKSLDIDVRKKLLFNFINKVINDKIDAANKKELLKYIVKYIDLVESSDYQEL